MTYASPGFAPGLFAFMGRLLKSGTGLLWRIPDLHGEALWFKIE